MITCRCKRPVAAATVALGTIVAAHGRVAEGQLTAAPALAHAYDLILDARFEAVAMTLRAACPPAPAEACALLQVAATWWRIQLDAENRANDAEFAALQEDAIARAEAWTDREPDRAEAWFYLGGAYGLRAQWRGFHGESLAAARDGSRIRKALERAIDLDPSLEDAYFGLGLYQYYADIAPLLARIFRWLLLLPGGDREAGLAQMLRVHDRGGLLRGEADYQLFLVYLWYEHDTKTALQLVRDLRARYPGNPLFAWREAELQEIYLHDPIASLTVYQDALQSALGYRPSLRELAETKARLEVARLLDLLYETDAAIDHLRAVVARRPQTRPGALAQAYLMLGLANDRLGRRDEAVRAYTNALGTAPPDREAIATGARTGLRRSPDVRAGEAYRLSLDAWRRMAHEPDQARRLFERALELSPNEPVIRYRYGVLLSAEHDEAALVQFERIIASPALAPATFLASTYLAAGHIYERRGEHDRALAMYARAAATFGGGADTHRAAMQAIDRLNALPVRPRE